MLTAEHVRVRKKNGELVIRPLDGRDAERALELAAAHLDVAREFVGRTRDELEEAWSAVPVAVRDRKLADGLRKLIEDASEFSADESVDPIALRGDLFLAASAARGALAPEERFARGPLVQAAAARHGISPDALERALYADLRGEQLLLAALPARPETLVEHYDRGQVQAVLLRAVRLTVDVACATPAAYRALFRELKFRRLIHRIERLTEGYRIEIDGPYSLFESVTKYGLQLALVLPALEACDALSLRAEIRWGKQREALSFHHRSTRSNRTEQGASAPRLREDIAALADAFRNLAGPWSVSESDVVLDLPGIGVCIPDLVFERRKKPRVYFEALGFWNRDAVWKRVELVERGLPSPILFAASSRLRVSESILDDAEAAALYVYKGVMSARAVERKLDELVGKAR